MYTHMHTHTLTKKYALSYSPGVIPGCNTLLRVGALTFSSLIHPTIQKPFPVHCVRGSVAGDRYRWVSHTSPYPVWASVLLDVWQEWFPMCVVSIRYYNSGTMGSPGQARDRWWGLLRQEDACLLSQVIRAWVGRHPRWTEQQVKSTEVMGRPGDEAREGSIWEAIHYFQASVSPSPKWK